MFGTRKEVYIKLKEFAETLLKGDVDPNERLVLIGDCLWETEARKYLEQEKETIAGEDIDFEEAVTFVLEDMVGYPVIDKHVIGDSVDRMFEELS